MKDNSECATLRIGRLPKAEAVRTATVDNDAACDAVKKQNMNDGDPTSLTVIPNSRIPAPPNTHGSEK